MTYAAPAGPATLTVVGGFSYEGETYDIDVTVDNAVAGGFTVTVSFTTLGRNAGSYADQTLTFEGLADETQTASITIVENRLPQSSNRRIRVNLEASLESIDDSDTAIINIYDDDFGHLAIDDVEAAEGENLSFTVRLNPGVVEDGFDVTLSYAAGTPNAATSGTDYTPYTQTIAFAGTANGRRTASRWRRAPTRCRSPPRRSR